MAQRFTLKLLVLASLEVAALMLSQGCAPVFSDFQDARLTGPSRLEVTPRFSAVSSSADGESEHVQNDFGIQLAWGVHPSVDLRVGYVHLQAASGESGINVLGFGPKVAVLKDRVALAVPVGFAFGGGWLESWQVHPTLLLTFPVTEHVDLNPSIKVLIPFCEDCETTVALNLGVGVRPEGQRWALRPELGFLVDPGESAFLWALGIGLSYYPNAR